MSNLRTVPVTAPAPALVRATVHHERRRPFTYGFRHTTTMWLVDAADPNAGFGWWARPLARIRSRDHFTADDTPLLDKVHGFLSAQRLTWSAHRVLVLTNARSLGYVFDPLTTYFCLDAEGHLEGVLAEVHNTYGERHCYALEVAEPRTSTDKAFYVSPFFAVEGRYDIRTRLTADLVAVAITLTSPDGETLFTGSVHGDLVPATTGRVLGALARNPLPSQRVSALIRWHGIRLWLRKLPVLPRPQHHPPKGMA